MCTPKSVIPLLDLRGDSKVEVKMLPSPPEEGINLIHPVSPVAELIRLFPVVSPLAKAATGTKTQFLLEKDIGVTF